MISKNIYFSFISLVFLFSCSKDSIAPLSLSETMIGKWEMREAVDPLEFQDREWHTLSPPFVSMNFSEEGIFSFTKDCPDTVSFCVDTIEIGTYTILEQDSIIQITTLFTRDLSLRNFTGDFYTICSIGDEGEFKSKYFKVE